MIEKPDDPDNERGDPPGRPLDEGAGSGNFTLAAPVLSHPGRGIDLSLNLVWNARVWNKANNEMSFDIDRDYPAPGWSLGFGRIIGLGSQGAMLVDADGTHHSFSGTVTTYPGGYINFVGKTTDGSFIDYSSSTDSTGNLVKTSTSCCEEMSFTYKLDTQFAYPESQTRGSADPNSTARVTASAVYDFSTGLTLTTTDANGRISQTTYFANTLRPQFAYLPTNGYTSFSYDDVAMTVTTTAYTASGAMASQNVKRLNGLGAIKREEALGQNNIWDIVDTTYDGMGRVWKQTRPFNSGAVKWSETAYDALGRVKSVTAPDGSQSFAYYNEATRPSAASASAGETTRVVDAWGRERWGRTDASGHLVEVVEPNPSGNGSVFAAGSLATTYSFDTLGNLTLTQQGAQQRSFRYDSIGRLTHQKLAEESATLNDAGQYVGSGTWSEVFTYDERSNLITQTDARGVKTVYTYNNDPLNRLQSVSYDTSGFGDTAYPIVAAATVSYQYMTTGDVTRLFRVTTTGVSTEEFAYDSEGRLFTRTQTLTNRSGYPMVTSYLYDSLDRVTDVYYPAQYGRTGTPRKIVHHDYDVSSRLSGLKVDGVSYASQIAYNAASQTTSLVVGSGSNQVTESYQYDSLTGLLTNQKVQRGTTSLLDLSYDYLRPNTTTGRTGQLTKIINNLNRNRDRAYEYDALGRLKKATGGQSANWTQDYVYDRYGNRTSVTATGNLASASEPGHGQSANQLLAWDPRESLPKDLREDPTRIISDVAYSLRLSPQPEASSSQPEASSPPSDFEDVPPSHPYYSYINMMKARGVTSGCSASPPLYCPNDPVTRAQMAVFLERALGVFNLPTPSGQTFADVPPSHWAYVFIEDFAQRGITAGCGGGNYCPDGNVTREQIAIFLERALGRPNPPTPSSQRFVDVPPSQWSYAFVESFVANNLSRGIMDVVKNGCNADGLHYCPGQPITRAEMAAFLAIAFGWNESTPAPSITSLSQTSGAQGTNVSLTINGTNLSNASTVNFTPPGGISVSGISSNAGQITATIAISALAATGTRNITVTTPGGPSNALSFTVNGAAGPVGYWRLDEASGTTASDSSGNNNHGTLQGGTTGPTWTTGKVAGGLGFDGVDDRVLVNNSSSLNPSTAITIAAWFTANPKNPSSHQFLVNKFNHNSGPAGNPSDDSYCLGIDPNGNLYWQLATNPGGGVINNLLTPTVTPAGLVFNNQFHHIAATYDGDAMRVYLNGALIGTTNASGPIVSTSTPLYLGASLNNSALAFFQKGILDDVRIYNRALSASEIQGLVGNTPPTVSITSPANGATFTAPASITVSANASDSDGTVSQVEFFANGSPIGTATSPYLITWSNVGAGSYSITARATDNAGATTTSSGVNVIVNAAGNNPPTVSITSPANGATFTAPATIPVSASASDSDGSITQVEFFTNGSPIGTDTTSSYGITWDNVAAGTYSLTARATDNLEATTTSSAISITVNPAPTPVPRDGLGSVSYDPATNRINSAGWEYDKVGNQTRAQRADSSWQRLVYDAAGRLARVTNDLGTTLSSFTYGASNHRIVEQVGNESSNQRTYYAWEGDSVIAEYSESDTNPSTPSWSKSYVYLGASLLATISPSGASERVEYHHPDRLGTRLVTNNQDTNHIEQAILTPCFPTRLIPGLL